MSAYPFRAHGSWVLLKRVRDRGSLIISVGEVHGVDDRILQVAEIVSVGPRAQALDPTVRLEAGELAVFNQARVHDHFRYLHEDILVYPGEWLLGLVRDTFLAEHPNHRQYDRQPI